MAFTEHVLQGALVNRVTETVVTSLSTPCIGSAFPKCGNVVDGGACSCAHARGSPARGGEEQFSVGIDFASSRSASQTRGLFAPASQVVMNASSSANVRCDHGSSASDSQRWSGQRNSRAKGDNLFGRITCWSLFSLSLSPAFGESAHASSNFWGGDGDGGPGAKVEKKKPALLTLASYAVTKAAYEQITRLFAEHWRKENNQEVHFRLSLAGSGAQARAVIDGLPADVVSLALPLDVLKIEEAGLIDSDWQTRVPNKGSPADTIVCIVTRPGNPKNITDWPDLIRSDVSVLTANPKTAGVARWNFLALWGSVIINGGSEEEAQRMIEKVFKNVPVEPRDAREVSDVFFKQGLGDVMITYENEILLTNKKIVEGGGEPLPYTIPSLNVRVETSIAVVDQNARKRGVHEVAQAFVNYCFTEPAQRIYAKSGFRPYMKSVAEEFNIIPADRPWNVEDVVGDWLFVQDKFFGDKGMIDDIEKNIRYLRRAA